jgi:redox-sensitive bicupin YhaK (pirin superfamily)
VHSEMFPLLNSTEPNPLELFQIWLNLPSASKLVPAYFSMLWERSIPKIRARDAEGKATEIAVVAGKLGERAAPTPPPHSWASRLDSDVAIWTISMQPGARWSLPATLPTSHRTLYFYEGERVHLDGAAVDVGQGIALDASRTVELHNRGAHAEFLLLGGRPIEEPVAHYGPFVMNTRQELEQAISDYRRTGFGGWPWASDGPVHPKDAGRFAKHADGRVEYAEPDGS